MVGDGGDGELEKFTFIPIRLSGVIIGKLVSLLLLL